MATEIAQIEARYPQENELVARARQLIASRSVSSATSDRTLMIPMYVAEIAAMYDIGHDQATIAVKSALEAMDFEAKSRDRREDKSLLRERLQEIRNGIMDAIRNPTEVVIQKFEPAKEEGERGRWVPQTKTIRPNHGSAALYSLLIEIERHLIVLEKMPNMAENQKIYELLVDKIMPSKKLTKLIKGGKSISGAVEAVVKKEMEEEREANERAE